MNKSYIICIDDEKAVLDALETKVQHKFGQNYAVLAFQSGYEALLQYEELIKQKAEIPVVICDFFMPDIRGDDVLHRIYNLSGDSYNILLSEQSTLSEIAEAINKTRLFKYISKPWNDNDLYDKIHEALDRYETKKQQKQENDSLKAIITELRNKIDSLYSKEIEKIPAWENENILLFNIDDIFFFSSEDRKILVTTRKGKYRVKKTMSQLESFLHSKNFFRCHKSYLINLKYVNKISPWISYDSYISTIDGCNCQIPVSKNYIKEMKRLLGI